MSKFLYPIYKLNIESYKKWWLYHKKAGSGILSEILQGFSFNLENTLNRKFKLFEIQGNSVQDGSPSPDNEVPIYSAGENENIIDIQPFNITGGTTSYNGKSFTYNLKAGTYTLQRKYTKSSNAPSSAGMVQLKKNNVYYKNLDAGVASTIVELTEDTELKLEFYLSTSITSAEESSIVFYDIKLEQGNKASGYSPYGMGSINEKIQTSNLINMIRTLGTPSNTGYDNTNKRTFDVTTLIKFLTANNYYNAGVQIDYSLTDNGIKITTKQAGYGIGFPVILNSAKTYTISANIDVIDNQMIRAIFYKEDGTYISNVTSSGTNKFLTFTTTDDTYFVVVMLTPKANVETTYSNIMLNEGNTALPYVEHQEQTYSIFVQQPFRSIGDVRDCFVKKSDGWYERHLPYIASYNGETLPQDVYNEVDNVKYCNEKSMSTTGQFSIGASVQYIDENNWNDLPCTPEQIQQLENKPSTYKDFTIIQSEDETPAHLKIQYWKEVQS